jgi:LysM repeat protein
MYMRCPKLLRLSSAAIVAGLIAPALGRAQSDNIASIIAGMREDIRILDERTRSLSAELEQVKRENRELREGAGNANNVTVAQLNAAVADLEKAIRAGDKDVALQLTKQMERLATQTQSALDTMAKGASGGRVNTPATPSFTEDYPKTGVTYVVQQGDTLANIAQRFKSSIRDIQNANKIADARSLQAGQTLFIPQK